MIEKENTTSGADSKPAASPKGKQFFTQLNSDSSGEEEKAEGTKQEERFAEALCEEFKFDRQWTLWEHYDNTNIDDYLNSMMKVCWFNDLMSFSISWNSIPHKDLKNLFYNAENQKVKYMMINNKETRINGLSLFLNEVHPSYEDEVNKQGGEFRMDFKSQLVFLQSLWEKLVFNVVTGEFNNADMISGVRLLDKSAAGRENFFRIEIWTKFSDSQQHILQEMQKHLEDEYIQRMVDDETTYNTKNKDGALSEWIKF